MDDEPEQDYQKDYFETIINKYECRNAQFTQRQCDLRQRLETIERSLPALMCFNIMQAKNTLKQPAIAECDCSPVKEVPLRSDQNEEETYRNLRNDRNLRSCNCNPCPLNPDYDSKGNTAKGPTPPTVNVRNDAYMRSCSCNPCPIDIPEIQEANILSNHISTTSHGANKPGKNNSNKCIVNTDDMRYMATIKELAGNEKKLREEIQELEHKERVYNETLKEPPIWAGKEIGCSGEGDFEIEALNRMNEELEESNKSLEQELEQVKNEIKHIQDTIEQPMRQELENEKCKYTNLEEKLNRTATDKSAREIAQRKKIILLQKQLQSANQNLNNLHAVNKRLKEELCMLNCRCNELQTDLINQKISEIHIVSRMTASQNKEIHQPPVPKPDSYGDGSDEDLNNIARNLSKLIEDATSCNNCKNTHTDLIDTVQYIKKLVDIVNVDKKTVSKSDNSSDVFCKCVDWKKIREEMQLEEPTYELLPPQKISSVGSVSSATTDKGPPELVISEQQKDTRKSGAIAAEYITNNLLAQMSIEETLPAEKKSVAEAQLPIEEKDFQDTVDLPTEQKEEVEQETIGTVAEITEDATDLSIAPSGTEQGIGSELPTDITETDEEVPTDTDEREGIPDESATVEDTSKVTVPEENLQADDNAVAADDNAVAVDDQQQSEIQEATTGSEEKEYVADESTVPVEEIILPEENTQKDDNAVAEDSNQVTQLDEKGDEPTEDIPVTMETEITEEVKDAAIEHEGESEEPLKPIDETLPVEDDKVTEIEEKIIVEEKQESLGQPNVEETMPNDDEIKAEQKEEEDVLIEEETTNAKELDDVEEILDMPKQFVEDAEIKEHAAESLKVDTGEQLELTGKTIVADIIRTICKCIHRDTPALCDCLLKEEKTGPNESYIQKILSQVISEIHQEPPETKIPSKKSLPEHEDNLIDKFSASNIRSIGGSKKSLPKDDLDVESTKVSKTVSKEASKKSLPKDDDNIPIIPAEVDVTEHTEEPSKSLVEELDVSDKESVVKSKGDVTKVDSTVPLASSQPLKTVSKKSFEESKPALKESSVKSLPQETVVSTHVSRDKIIKAASDTPIKSPPKSKAVSKESSIKGLPIKESTTKSVPDDTPFSEPPETDKITSKKASVKSLSKEKSLEIPLGQSAKHITSKPASKEVSARSLPKEPKEETQVAKEEEKTQFEVLKRKSSIKQDKQVSKTSVQLSDKKISSVSGTEDYEKGTLVADFETEGNVQVEAEVELISKSSDGVYVTTTVTSSGHVEVTTEGPTGVVETTLKVTESGNLEVVTGVTEYDKVSEGGMKEIEPDHIKQDPDVEVIHPPVCDIEESQDGFDIHESVKSSDQVCYEPKESEAQLQEKESPAEDTEELKASSEGTLGVITEEDEATDLKRKRLIEERSPSTCGCKDKVVAQETDVDSQGKADVVSQEEDIESVKENVEEADITSQKLDTNDSPIWCKCNEDETEDMSQIVDDESSLPIILCKCGKSETSETEFDVDQKIAITGEDEDIAAERQDDIIQEDAHQIELYTEEKQQDEIEGEVYVDKEKSQDEIEEEVYVDKEEHPDEIEEEVRAAKSAENELETQEEKIIAPAEIEHVTKKEGHKKRDSVSSGSSVSSISMFEDLHHENITEIKESSITTIESAPTKSFVIETTIEYRNIEQLTPVNKPADTSKDEKTSKSILKYSGSGWSSDSSKHVLLPNPEEAVAVATSTTDIKFTTCTCNEKQLSPEPEETSKTQESFSKSTDENKPGTYSGIANTTVNNLKIIICNRDSCKTYTTEEESESNVPNLPKCECGRPVQRKSPKVCDKKTCGTGSPNQQDKKKVTYSNDKLLLENATCTTCDIPSCQVIKSGTHYASVDSMLSDDEALICPDTCPSVGVQHTSPKKENNQVVCPKSCDDMRTREKVTYFKEKTTKSYSKGMTADNSTTKAVCAPNCSSKGTQQNVPIGQKTHSTNTPKSSKICDLDICASKASEQRTVSTYYSCDLLQTEHIEDVPCRPRPIICDPNVCKSRSKSPSEPKVSINLPKYCNKKTCKNAATDYRPPGSSSQKQVCTCKKESTSSKVYAEKSESIMETACTSLTCSGTQFTKPTDMPVSPASNRTEVCTSATCSGIEYFTPAPSISGSPSSDKKSSRKPSDLASETTDRCTSSTCTSMMPNSPINNKKTSKKSSISSRACTSETCSEKKSGDLVSEKTDRCTSSTCTSMMPNSPINNKKTSKKSSISSRACTSETCSEKKSGDLVSEKTDRCTSSTCTSMMPSSPINKTSSKKSNLSSNTCTSETCTQKVQSSPVSDKKSSKHSSLLSGRTCTCSGSSLKESDANNQDSSKTASTLHATESNKPQEQMSTCSDILPTKQSNITEDREDDHDPTVIEDHIRSVASIENEKEANEFIGTELHTSSSSKAEADKPPSPSKSSGDREHTGNIPSKTSSRRSSESGSLKKEISLHKQTSFKEPRDVEHEHSDDKHDDGGKSIVSIMKKPSAIEEHDQSDEPSTSLKKESVVRDQADFNNQLKASDTAIEEVETKITETISKDKGPENITISRSKVNAPSDDGAHVTKSIAEPIPSAIKNGASSGKIIERESSKIPKSSAGDINKSSKPGLPSDGAAHVTKSITEPITSTIKNGASKIIEPESSKIPKSSTGDSNRSPKSASRYTLTEKVTNMVNYGKKSAENVHSTSQSSKGSVNLNNENKSATSNDNKQDKLSEKFSNSEQAPGQINEAEGNVIPQKGSKTSKGSTTSSTKSSVGMQASTEISSKRKSGETLSKSEIKAKGSKTISKESICQPCGRVPERASGDKIIKRPKEPPDKDSKGSILTTDSTNRSKSKIPVLITKTSSQIKEKHQGDCACIECLTEEVRKTGHPLDCDCVDCLCQPKKFEKQLPTVQESEDAKEVELAQHSPSCTCIDCLCEPKDTSKRPSVERKALKIKEKVKHSASCDCIDCLCAPTPEGRKSIQKVTAFVCPSIPPVKTKQHHPDCKCPDCICDPCGHQPNCSCALCKCDPCKDVVVEFKKHPPDCSCPDCICAPCGDGKVEERKNKEKQKHDPRCSCSECLCDKSASKGKIEQVKETPFVCPSIPPVKIKQHHPDCKCPDCVCDPCGHQPNCSCALCKCDPCNDIVVEFKKHAPDCSCPDCICAPCGDEKVEERKKHPPQCNCSECLCEPCADAEIEKKKKVIKDHVKEDGDCTCQECVCDPCDDPKIASKKQPCGKCGCIICICSPCEDPKIISDRTPHPPSCNCPKCVCDPCKDPSKSKDHGPNCKCSRCVCHPCKSDAKHGPSCNCPICSCSPCADPEKKSIHGPHCTCKKCMPHPEEKKSVHRSDCTCKKCICDPCKSDSKHHPPDCNCQVCKCDPCLDPKKKKSVHGLDCICEKCANNKPVPSQNQPHSRNCKCSTCKHGLKDQQTQKPGGTIAKHSTKCKCSICKHDKSKPKEASEQKATCREVELPGIPEECPECDCSPICVCDDCPAKRNNTAPLARNMKNETLKKNIKDIEKENRRREKDITELEGLMKQIRCACRDAEKQAARSCPPETMSVQKASSFKNTLSGLQIAMTTLQDKCRVKDKMIEAMTQELRLRANSNIFQDMFKNMAALPPASVDFDRHEVCDSLPRPLNDPQYGRPSYRYAENTSTCVCDQGSTNMEIISVKQISPNSILIKWTQPESAQVIGYEVVINNVLKSRIHSVQRTSAVIFAIDTRNKSNINIYAITQFGRCQPPATCVYGT